MTRHVAPGAAPGGRRRHRALFLSALLPFAASLCAAQLRASTDLRRTHQAYYDLEECLERVKVPILTAARTSKDDYASASEGFNLLYHFVPAVIAQPSDVHQVGLAVQCAAANGVAVAARSGGHSFGGFGSGGQDGSLVVDLAHLSGIAVVGDEGLLRVGPGARLGDIAKTLWESGRRAMPHGTCPAVGLGGHALCGGFGPTSRHWGLATDGIVEADVVLANGSLVRASETYNRELLWALKGSGSFFGIVTSFLFRTYPAPDKLTYVDWTWDHLSSAKSLAATFSAIQDALLRPDLPSELGFHLQLAPPTHSPSPPRPGVVLKFRAAYLRSRADFDHRVARPVLAALHAARDVEPDKQLATQLPSEQKTEEVDYITLLQRFDDFGRPNDKLDAEWEKNIKAELYAKTQLSLGQRPLSVSAALQALETVWSESHRRAWNVYIELFGGPQSAVRSETACANGRGLGTTSSSGEQQRSTCSSFAHRDSLWLVQSSCSALRPISRSARRHVRALDQAFARAFDQDGTARAGYSCYVDPELEEEEWRKTYYGSSLDRLERLKVELDPDNVFRNPQSIGTPRRGVPLPVPPPS